MHVRPFRGELAVCPAGQLGGGWEQVYTAPAQAGPGQVTSTTGLGASSGCPAALPSEVTIDTTAGIDAGGAQLAAFLSYLHEHRG